MGGGPGAKEENEGRQPGGAGGVVRGRGPIHEDLGAPGASRQPQHQACPEEKALRREPPMRLRTTGIVPAPAAQTFRWCQ